MSTPGTHDINSTTIEGKGEVARGNDEVRTSCDNKPT